MQGAARLFFTLAVIYAICGMLLGIHMAMSNNHLQMPTHAHIMVAGWVMSAIFAYFYHLFPQLGASKLAMVHFWLQAVSGVVLVVTLFFVLAGNAAIEPVTGVASIGFLLGMVLFAYISLPAIWKA